MRKRRSNFGDILRRGRKMHDLKEKGGEWGRCEECDERAICYPYVDERKQIWMLCEECATIFVKDD